MDVNSVTQLITNVGFPIACCIYMAYLIHEMSNNHANEMDKMKDALNANTSAIEKLETLINQLMLRFTVNDKSEKKDDES